MHPSKRFSTVVLALGTVVLLAAVVIGQVMGYRVLNQSTELHPLVLPTVLVTPEPADTSGPAYGPDWRRTQTLSAAPDPGFPDPRVPPVPLPTPTPTPKPTPTPVPTPTPNPNIPIWDRSPFPTMAPSASPAGPLPSGAPQPSPSSLAASPGATTPPY
jgi:hypothetical protein